MKKTDINKIIKIAEKLDWKITETKGEFELENFSPAGQDFNKFLSKSLLYV